MNMTFFVGFIFGGLMGFTVAALCVAASDNNDDNNDNWYC